MTRDERYIKQALELAKKAGEQGEVPVGAVVVLGDNVVGKGYNTREQKKSVLGHAEINAIEQATKHVQDFRLNDCEIFVTLEPCAMCMGAISAARIKRLVFGAFDKITGCAGSVCEINEMSFSPIKETLGGVLEKQCKQTLEEFFLKLRKEP